MAEAQADLTRRSLTTPRAAAIAGILFAVLNGASMLLLRLSMSPDSAADSAAWLEASSGMMALALNLVPYEGIAFLWFIGVIRDRTGNLEDRFFGTVFLGSGLLFLALTFIGAALAGGLLASYAVAPNVLVVNGVFAYGRAVVFEVINVYSIRMAGVFMISLGTIWLRTGLMSRRWVLLSYALALMLLVTVSHSQWVTLVFPPGCSRSACSSSSAVAASDKSG